MSFREQPFSQQGRGRPQQPARAASEAAANRAPVKLPVFEVVGLVPVRTGNLLAFADVRIGREPTALIVRKWRIVQQPGQVAYLSPPQESWNDPATGERRFKTLFEFSKAWRQALTDTALAAWREHEQQQGGPV